MVRHQKISRSFFFNDTATTEIYTLSLHDALPISSGLSQLASELQKKSQNLYGVLRDMQAAQLLRRDEQIGKAHVLTPVTLEYRMPSSALKKKARKQLRRHEGRRTFFKGPSPMNLK